ncbi:unnamed protein product [Sphagnum tenellum]
MNMVIHGAASTRASIPEKTQKSALHNSDYVVEDACPGIVSSADIIPLATRDAVVTVSSPGSSHNGGGALRVLLQSSLQFQRNRPPRPQYGTLSGGVLEIRLSQSCLDGPGQHSSAGPRHRVPLGQELLQAAGEKPWHSTDRSRAHLRLHKE